MTEVAPLPRDSPPGHGAVVSGASGRIVRGFAANMGGVGVTLANADYMQSYFGVTAAQAAATGYAIYSAGSEARDARANVALTYSIDQRTSVTAVLSASSLLGDAQDSPLTRKRTSGSGVLGINYAF